VNIVPGFGARIPSLILDSGEGLGFEESSSILFIKAAVELPSSRGTEVQTGRPLMLMSQHADFRTPLTPARIT